MNAEPAGKMVHEVYLHESPIGNKERAVVLLTDIFGLPLVNSKLIADEISNKLECDVWVPDLFNGKPVFGVDELTPLVPTKAGTKMSFWTILCLIFTIVPRLYRMFAIRPSVTDPKLDKFMTKIRNDYGYKKIGAVGYCFGGSAGVRIGSRDKIDSLVVCHPGRCSINEIKAIKVPTAWICAEEDIMFSPSLRNQAEAIFAARKGKDNFIEYEFEDYEGTIHGFAARPNLRDAELAEAYNGAIAQTIAWFEKTL